MLGAHPWRGKRVLVTGGGGFIGTRLAARLADEGAEVHAVGRRRPAHLAADVETWGRDVSRQDHVRELVDAIQPETIFHLASAVTGSRDIEHVRTTFDGNLTTTVNLLVEATKADCGRIVLTGSMEEPRAKDPDPLPPSPYAAAKWASTVYARMFRALYASPVVVLRVFMVYGPGQQDEKKVIPYVGRCFLDGTTPELSSGRRSVDWVFVDDVVEAYLRAAQKPEAVGRVLDVGSGKQVTIREVVARLAYLTGTDVEAKFGALPDRPLEGAPIADVDETYRILGWRAQTDLNEGLSRTLDWLRGR